MKTVKEWLQELPEPYRTQSLENCTNPDEEVKLLSEALGYGFYWGRTKQGYMYWSDIFDNIHSEGK
jgi:hypothetical protein